MPGMKHVSFVPGILASTPTGTHCPGQKSSCPGRCIWARAFPEEVETGEEKTELLRWSPGSRQLSGLPRGWKGQAALTVLWPSHKPTKPGLSSGAGGHWPLGHEATVAKGTAPGTHSQLEGQLGSCREPLVRSPAQGARTTHVLPPAGLGHPSVPGVLPYSWGEDPVGPTTSLPMAATSTRSLQRVQSPRC